MVSCDFFLARARACGQHSAFQLQRAGHIHQRRNMTYCDRSAIQLTGADGITDGQFATLWHAENEAIILSSTTNQFVAVEIKDQLIIAVAVIHAIGQFHIRQRHDHFHTIFCTGRKNITIAGRADA